MPAMWALIFHQMLMTAIKTTVMAEPTMNITNHCGAWQVA